MIKSYTEKEVLQIIEENENVIIEYDGTELANNAFTPCTRHDGKIEFREGRRVAEHTKRWLDICGCELKIVWKK